MEKEREKRYGVEEEERKKEKEKKKKKKKNRENNTFTHAYPPPPPPSSPPPPPPPPPPLQPGCQRGGRQIFLNQNDNNDRLDSKRANVVWRSIESSCKALTISLMDQSKKKEYLSVYESINVHESIKWIIQKRLFENEFKRLSIENNVTTERYWLIKQYLESAISGSRCVKGKLLKTDLISKVSLKQGSQGEKGKERRNKIFEWTVRGEVRGWGCFIEWRRITVIEEYSAQTFVRMYMYVSNYRWTTVRDLFHSTEAQAAARAKASPRSVAIQRCTEYCASVRTM
ncbi:hypothetical protein V1478_014873 [Vespula squamosa]|uniref:Uncharacterized protein n=1 Tax=Vespula squamosa TaxID=30214 RepID=A0ABD2A642_VESSQ